MLSHFLVKVALQPGQVSPISLFATINYHIIGIVLPVLRLVLIQQLLQEVMELTQRRPSIYRSSMLELALQMQSYVITNYLITGTETVIPPMELFQ